MDQNATKSSPIYSTLGNDPDLGELVDMFVEEMPGRVEKIQNLLQNSQWEDLRRAAHQLKGAAGSYGFLKISPVAAVLEDKIRGEEPENEIRKAVDSLCDICRCARGGSPH